MTLDDVLTDDAAFEAYCYDKSQMRYGPFVRANTYPDFGQKQDMVPRNRQFTYSPLVNLLDQFWSDFGDDPRRPVVMRGARQIMVARYQWQSYYAYAVAERFLKRRKINLVTDEGCSYLFDLIIDHFTRRGIYVHDQYRVLPRFHWGQNEVCCIVEGERHHLPGSHLPGLQSRLRKAGKLGPWDLVPIMQRLDELCLIRRERECRRIELLLQHFKRLRKMRPERQPEMAAALLKWHKGKQRKNLTAFR